MRVHLFSVALVRWLLVGAGSKDHKWDTQSYHPFAPSFLCLANRHGAVIVTVNGWERPAYPMVDIDADFLFL